MKNVIAGILVVLVIIFLWLWSSSKGEIEKLNEQLVSCQDSSSTTDTEEEEEIIVTESNENANTTADCSVYKNTIDSLNNAITNLEKPKKQTSYSSDEKAIHELIYNLHASWEKSFKTNNPDLLISNFMPTYTTNEVMIDVKNAPHTHRYNDTNFKKHLQQMIDTKYLVDFGTTEFIFTFVKGDIFTATYDTEFTFTDKSGKLIQKGKIITYVSGQKHEGKWKVGNYSWTKYDVIDKR